MLTNSLKPSLFRLYRAAQYSKFARRPAALRILSRFPKLDLSVLELSASGPQVFIKGTDIDTTAAHCQFLLRGSDCVRRLMQEAGAVLRALPDGVLLEVMGVKLKLQDWEELFIATEVFAEGIYNLHIPADFVLVDIGLNVATTSLFFARSPRCLRIYGFELFPRTLAKARINLELNPDLAQKIQVTAKGVAARQFSTDLDYFEEHKGSVGINGLPGYIQSDPGSARAEKVRVEFLAGADVLHQVAQSHPGMSVVCKVDCEGAEYEIMENLAASGWLARVEYFMIEWHLKGAAPLEHLLHQHGFSTLCFSPHAPTHSMIYAWRPTANQAVKAAG